VSEQPSLTYSGNNYLMNRISYTKRKEMFDVLQKLVDFEKLTSVLDVGVTADYPGLTFIQGNGLDMPFEKQCEFFNECLRISRKIYYI